MSNELSKTDFDYGCVDEETASKLEYFAKTGKSLIRKSQVEFIAKFGEVLSDARKMLASHDKTEGTFVRWSTAEFDITKQTVYNYVNAWDRILSNGWTTYLNWSATALYLASSDDFSKPVLKKLEKFPPSELVRTSDVKRLIDASKPADPEDVPFGTSPTMTSAAAEKAAKAAAKEKARAEAKAAKEKAKEEAKAAKAIAREEAKAAKAKAREEAKAAKMRALPKAEQAKLLRSHLQQHVDAAARLAYDLHRVIPNIPARTAVVKALQGIKLW